MFYPKDNSYNDIREKSLNSWLSEMEQQVMPAALSSNQSHR